MEKLREKILFLWGESSSELGFQITQLHDGEEYQIKHQDNQIFNVASAFKSIPLAAFLYQVESGKYSLADTVTLSHDLRVPDSEYTDSLTDGTVISYHSLLDSMIRVSDNTATEVIMSKLDDSFLSDLLLKLEITETKFPKSLKKAFDTYEMLQSVKEFQEIFYGDLGILSTPDNLVKLYKEINEGKLFKKEETLDFFKQYMRSEDISQKTSWPEGITCYRKSGNIDVSTYYGFSMAGWIERNNRSTIYFSIITNLNGNEEKANENLIKLKNSIKFIFEYARNN